MSVRIYQREIISCDPEHVDQVQEVMDICEESYMTYGTETGFIADSLKEIGATAVVRVWNDCDGESYDIQVPEQE